MGWLRLNEERAALCYVYADVPSSKLEVCLGVQPATSGLRPNLCSFPVSTSRLVGNSCRWKRRESPAQPGTRPTGPRQTARLRRVKKGLLPQPARDHPLGMKGRWKSSSPGLGRGRCPCGRRWRAFHIGCSGAVLWERNSSGEQVLVTFLFWHRPR